MGWLLDTNIVSELRKGDRANPGLRSWFALAEEESLFTSVLVVGELRRGIEALRRRDGPSALALDHWLASLNDRFRTVDGLLAATALVHGMTLLTRNTRDVATTGVSLLDPMN